MVNEKVECDIQYYDVIESVPLFGLNVLSCGYQSIKPFEGYPPKNHPKEFYFEKDAGRVLSEYQILYITEGVGQLLVNDTFYAVNKGDIIFLQPGQKHTYYPISEYGWDEYYIGFKGNLIDDILANKFISTEQPLMSIGLNNELVLLFKSAIELVRSRNGLISSQLAGIVMHIIGLLIYEVENFKSIKSKSSEIVENAKIVMSQSLYIQITPEEIASKLNMSYSLFRKLFRRCIGVAPGHYMQLMKIQKAKQFLLETNMPIKEIAYKLCFNSLETFVIAFKNKTKETPTQYRNSCRLSN